MNLIRYSKNWIKIESTATGTASTKPSMNITKREQKPMNHPHVDLFNKKIQHLIIVRLWILVFKIKVTMHFIIHQAQVNHMWLNPMVVLWTTTWHRKIPWNFTTKYSTRILQSIQLLRIKNNWEKLKKNKNKD